MGFLDFLTGRARQSGQQTYQIAVERAQGLRSALNTPPPRQAPPDTPATSPQRPRNASVTRSGIPTGDPTGANRPVSNPTESMFTYPIYTGAKSLADAYKTNITDRYAGYVEPRLQGRGAWEVVGQAGVGLVSSPGFAIEFLAMIPAGAERLAREGMRDASTVPYHAAAGLSMQYEGITRGIRENPGRTVGELVGTGLVTHGVGKGARPIYAAGKTTILKGSPFYERGMRVYTGFPSLKEVITGEQMPGEFHYTLRGTPERLLDPALSQAPSIIFTTAPLAGSPGRSNRAANRA